MALMPRIRQGHTGKNITLVGMKREQEQDVPEKGLLIHDSGKNRDTHI